MEFNNHKTVGIGGFGANIPVLLSCERVVSEIAEDFTIPEYMPEIRRLLRVDATVASPSRYLAATALKLSGVVEYCAVYVGIDGRIHAATLSDEYEMSAPFAEGALRDPDGATSAFAYAEVDDIVCKVTGARKINVKARVCAQVKAVGTRWEGAGSDLPAEPHIEKLAKSTEYYCEYIGENGEMEAVDELELSGGDRYISSGCRVFVEDATAREGYAEVRGSVIMCHLIEKVSGGIYEISRRIPFSETVEIDGLDSSCSVSAFGKCNAIIKSENDDEEGGGSISVNAHILIVAHGYKKCEMGYVLDAFSTLYESEAEESEFELPVLYGCANKNLTLMESVSPEDVLGGGEWDGREVTSVVVSASADGVTLSESGKYVISGKCRFYNLLSRYGEGDELEYSSSTVEVPFKYECAESGEAPDITDVFVEAIDPRVKCDGESASVGCEILISYGICGKKRIKCVDGCCLGGERRRMRSGYTVCYPDISDTLWSVVKRYGASVSATAKSNGIPASEGTDTILSSEGIKYLIV